MATTLVIKNANFANNKVATVDLSTDIPCTGITLNHSTLSVDYYIGTAALIASPVPSDTTDAITWGSSDTDVATVDNGVITVIGVGQTTVTVSCGNYTASCSVVVSAVMDGTYLPGAVLGGPDTYSGGNGLPTVSTGAERYGTAVHDDGTLHFYRAYEDVMYYPYPFPANTKKLKFTILDQNITLYMLSLMSINTPAAGYPEVAQFVQKIQVNDIQPVDGVYELTVPSYTGLPEIDSVAFSIRKPSGSTVTLSDFENITLEFLGA